MPYFYIRWRRGGNVGLARDILLDGISGNQAYYAMLGVGLAGVAFAARRQQANKV